MEQIWESGQPTMASLFFNAVFTLLVLALLNEALRRHAPRWALRPGELVVVYAMLCVGTALAGHDQLQVLSTLLTYPFYYATPANDWANLFFDRLPSGLLVSDPAAVKGFWEGAPTLYSWKALQPWLPATGAWLGFVVLMLGAMMCINVFVRKRWTEEEKLSYPLIEMPLELSRPGLPVLHRRLLWIGFALAASIDLYNGLAFLHPVLPQIHVTAVDLSPRFRTYPWRAMGYTPVAAYPFAIGLGYLMPLDMLFSSWFFFWFWKAQRIIGHAVGWHRVPRFPFVGEQSFGAYCGIAVFALYTGRRFLEQVVRGLMGAGPRVDDRAEALPYGYALGGILLGVGGLVLFGMSFGLSFVVAIAFFAGYFLLSLAITRMRAEFGVPAHDLYGTGAEMMIVSTVGARALGPSNLVMLALFWWFNRAQRSHPMPHGLEGLALARRQQASARSALAAIMLAVVIGALAGLWSMLRIGYTRGVATLTTDSTYLARDAFIRLQSWLTVPQKPSLPAALAIVSGTAFTLLLLTMRLRFLWWPFHPVGYAISSSILMGLLWVPMLIAWLFKILLMRYAGARSYRRAIPFFFGLILGEFVVGSLWTVVGMIGRFPTYRFWAY